MPLIASLLAPSAAAEGVLAPHALTECPRLFGTPELRARNAERRTNKLYWTEKNDRLEVAHGARWRTPEPVYFPGVRVVGVEPKQAVVQLDERFGRLDCPAGTYTVRIDDSFGQGNRVLALFPGVMLVELNRKLAWLGAPGAEPPTWRMIWGSPYYFRRPAGKVTATRGKANPVRRQPRRPTRRR